MRVQIITKPGSTMTGTSRYVTELHSGLLTASVPSSLKEPSPLLPSAIASAVRRTGVDVQAFFESYPLRVSLDEADIYHIPTQTMATLLRFSRFPAPVVVTVLDIIPYLVRNDPDQRTFRHHVDAAFYHIALNALKRADAIIAISEYTRQTLVDELGLERERIYVTHLGVDQQRFQPLDIPMAFRDKYHLPEDGQYVLYVGSEDPRKNLSTLVKAFAGLNPQDKGVKLLKVGRTHFEEQRARLLTLVDELGIREQVTFIDDVDDADLPLFYNAADVVVLPSYYEGFGLPAIEAMACGTPVVVSNRSSLPELVDDQSAQVDPTDVNGMRDAIRARLNGGQVHDGLVDNASRFTWANTVQKTCKVYESVLEAYHG